MPSRMERADQRILHATVDALRERQRLPGRDPRRSSASWLRPSWPIRFLLTTHRKSLVKQLLDDAELRSEVRSKLASGLDHIEIDCTTTDDLTARLHAAVDPDRTLFAAATHPDHAVAAAAYPYLLGTLEAPCTARAPGGPDGVPPKFGKKPAPSEPPPDSKLEQIAKKSQRELEKRAVRAEGEALRLHTELVAAQSDAAAAKSEVADLRTKLPTRRQRKALAAASELHAELERTKRALQQSRKDRSRELDASRHKLEETERELGRLQSELASEQRGRRRLVDELGDATERARRLLPLVRQESASLTTQAKQTRMGPTRTRLEKRAQALDELAERLAGLYRLEAPTLPSAPALEAPATPARVTTVALDRGLRITPLGGNNHIGGSALLLEAGGSRILVDAGLRPDAHVSRPGPKGIDAAAIGGLDAVLITHAHADHAGYVPWVIERQRRAKVLCTPETAALLPTVWADSVRVMRSEADGSSRNGDYIEPPYGEGEVEQAEEAIHRLHHGRTATVGAFEITLFPAGHILGAAGAVIRVGDRRVVITGDIDNRAQASVGPAKIPPRLARNADLLIIETTYCTSVHNDRAQEGTDLVTAAETLLAAGGRVLVPAFGLGRAQEIALLLGERMPNIDVLIDGLARDISDLYARNGAPEVFRGRVRRVADRYREIRGFGNGIIITTSGMLTGGAAVPWAHAILQEPQSGLFLCGHQDEEAPGKQLEELIDADPESPRQIHLRDPETGRPLTIPVAASVMRYNLSAHADRNGLLAIIDEVDPKAVMLVHGEPGPQRLFARQLEAAGRVVVDNDAVWDSQAPVVDRRRPRRRHAAKASRNGGGRR